MIYSDLQIEDTLMDLVENTFDTCESNKDEIRWLICILRNFMNIPNKRNEYHIENYKINKWQYELHPIIENYKRKWKCSNYD